MRIAAIDSMTPSMPDFTVARVRIDQFPARRATGVLLAVLLALAAVLLSPFYLVATAALADQELRDAAATRPLAIVQICMGLAVWLLLLGFPIYRLLDTLTRSRVVEIASGRVSVADRSFGRSSVWSAPVADFLGLAPYLRASLSGVRHELILVHPDRERSVLVAMAPRLMQLDVDHVAAALGLKEVSPQILRT
ncbi:MAG: hypothetical protein K2Q28_14345 [Hyphomicrobium sp.]|nr:hypothetical protein [Hyphomicrobium sp.]